MTLTARRGRDGAAQFAFLQHRDGKESAGASEVEEGRAGWIGVVSWLGLGVRDLDRLFRRRHPSKPGPRIGAKHWVALPLLGKGSQGIVQCDGAESIALTQPQDTELGLA